jgi:hypothetical protein
MADQGAGGEIPDDIGVGEVSCPACNTTLAVVPSPYASAVYMECPCGRVMEVLPDVQ